MLLLFKLVLLTSPLTTMALMVLPVAKPGCQTRCGNLEVPYPLGIGVGSNCSIDTSFDLTCDSTHYDPPKLFIGSGNIEIWNITDTELRVQAFVSYKCYDRFGNENQNHTDWVTLGSSAFTFSQKNKFTVVGCDDFAIINRTNNEGVVASGCFGFCTNPDDVPDGYCSGVGCCETYIPKGLTYITSTLSSFANHTSVHSYGNNCGLSILGEEKTFQFHGKQDLENVTKFWDRINSTVPAVLEWVIEGNCTEPTECKGNSTCTDADIGGYRCSCMKGYEGNPYLDPGCQDIDECKVGGYCYYPNCINTAGNYSCTCPRGYDGDARTQNGCKLPAKPSKFPVMIFTLALLFCLVVTVCGVTAVFFGVRKRKLIKLREKFFEKNGGVFLKQKLNNAPGTTEAVIMFSTEQLLKATDDYAEDRIIGRGGYGVVYKGILADKSVVAIKKSKQVDGTQSEQFINEVLILTQVIHRNVVKLLGCCLEEEVPVLVYEFIANNTLFYHLHHKSGGMSWLSWENRLRIATEAADALGYLHSQATMPIIHRDVKSTNILLDENYTTKISDFGASRLVPLDHDQVTTLVQGTLGYLDPEYFHTSQLTDKSDVYSFGVVLAELITGQKPLCADRTNEEKNLATYFVKAMKENRLFEIVEPRVLREGTLEQLQQVADLVKRCVYLQGNDRPTMKEVAMELESLKKLKTHPWIQQQTREETRSLILEVEQSDLYEVPLIPYSSSEWDSYSGSSNMGLQINKPR